MPQSIRIFYNFNEFKLGNLRSNSIPWNSTLKVIGKETTANFLVNKSNFSWYCCYFTTSSFENVRNDLKSFSLFFVSHLVLYFSEDISSQKKSKVIEILKQKVYPYLTWLCIINGNTDIQTMNSLFLEKKVRLKEIFMLNEAVDKKYVDEETLSPLFATTVDQTQEADKSKGSSSTSLDSSNSSESDTNRPEQAVPMMNSSTRELPTESSQSKNHISEKAEMLSATKDTNPAKQMSEQTDQEIHQLEQIHLPNEEMKQGNESQQSSDGNISHEINTLDLLYSAAFTNPIVFSVAKMLRSHWSSQYYIFNNMKYEALLFTGNFTYMPITDISPFINIIHSTSFVKVNLMVKSKSNAIFVNQSSSANDLFKAVLLFINCFQHIQVRSIELIYKAGKIGRSFDLLRLENSSTIQVNVTEKSNPLSWSGISTKYTFNGEIRSAHVPPSLNVQELLQNELLFSVHVLSIHIPILQDNLPPYSTLCRVPLPFLKELTIFTQSKINEFHIEYLFSILHMALTLVRICGM